jgi:glutamyl-tRNA reductase
LLCELKSVAWQQGWFERYFIARENASAIVHLFETACGLRSQVLGEDQILAQVKNAIETAREARSADVILEKLFQAAITSAKKIKTQLRLTTADSSTAHAAIHKIHEYFTSLEGVRCLVIGNGEMGRLAADLLAEQDAKVYITLRNHKQGKNAIPERCEAVPYDDRLSLVPSCDIIISATISPHNTLTYDAVSAISALDKRFVFIDLAVPRDIDERVADLPNAILIDMDAIGTQPAINRQALEQAGGIIAECTLDFYKWYVFRRCLNGIIGRPDAINMMDMVKDETDKLPENIWAGDAQAKSGFERALIKALQKSMNPVHVQ